MTKLSGWLRYYSSTLSIQQVLLNLENNIVQASFSEQRCINRPDQPDQFLRVYVARTSWNTSYSWNDATLFLIKAISTLLTILPDFQKGSLRKVYLESLPITVILYNLHILQQDKKKFCIKFAWCKYIVNINFTSICAQGKCGDGWICSFCANLAIATFALVAKLCEFHICNKRFHNSRKFP